MDFDSSIFIPFIYAKGTLQHFTIMEVAEEELAFARLFSVSQRGLLLRPRSTRISGYLIGGENLWA